MHVFQEFRTRTDYAHRTVFNADSLNLWVSFRCDFYGSIMLLAICAFAVAEKDRGSAVVGLAFSNTIQLLVFYTWTLRLITEAVALAGSVEQLTWLAKSTPIDGQDDVNNAGQSLASASPYMLRMRRCYFLGWSRLGCCNALRASSPPQGDCQLVLTRA